MLKWDITYLKYSNVFSTVMFYLINLVDVCTWVIILKDMILVPQNSPELMHDFQLFD